MTMQDTTIMEEETTGKQPGISRRTLLKMAGAGAGAAALATPSSPISKPMPLQHLSKERISVGHRKWKHLATSSITRKGCNRIY